ncbi:hypothetical protein ACFY8N_30810 [Streptomyces collinus]|uniref:hypothetical protein n=1 Tax=Streptomyces collinus TaxID=42684 RepID=UPI0036A952DE
MPLPIIFLIAATIGLTVGAAAVAVACWDRIVGWTKSTFLPWMEKYFPELADLAHRAFMSLHGVVRKLRTEIREAWTALRTRLVRQLVEFSRTVDNQWTVKTISWFVASLSPDGSPQFVEQETTRPVHIEEVPPELLESWMRRREDTITFDLLELRDKEVMEVELMDEEDEGDSR